MPDDTTADVPDDTTADVPVDTTADVPDDTTADVPDGDVEPAPLEPLFTTTAVHDVRFTLDPAAFATLRAEERSRLEMFGGDCQAAPHPSPFTYQRATLVIDGVTFADVGLRKKGWLGSVERARPSLRVSVDKYVAGQQIAGFDDLVFNNARQDRAVVRQCLGYARFSAAGLPAPRCGFARVHVNGEDLGLYVMLEAIDGDFLESRFADPDGAMYEGVFSDFRAGWLGSFEPETDAAAAAAGADLAALAAVLDGPLEGDALVTALAPLVDLDAFFTFAALEALFAHRDGYTNRGNNFHVYRDPARGFVFVPHGIDQIMDDELVTPGDAAYAAASLPRRLLAVPAARARYVAALRAVLADVWSEAALHAELDALFALLAPHAGPDARDPDVPGSLAAAFVHLRAVIDARRDALEASLATAEPSPDGALESVCYPERGTLGATFSAPFGSFPLGAPGTGTLVVELDGASVPLGDARTRIGLSGERAIILVSARDADAREWRLELTLDLARFAPGTLTLDWVHDGALVFAPEGGVTSNLGELGPATLVLDAAEATPGATISGHIEGTLTDTIR